MCRIEFAEHRAVQPLIGPHGTEFRAAEHGSFPLGYLDPLYAAASAHDVLPRELVIDGQPSNPARLSGGYFLAPRGSWALRPAVADSLMRSDRWRKNEDSKPPVPSGPADFLHVVGSPKRRIW